tara:strand:- start:32 stop:247 length:216 start_codon:yes stop_codon:yes gene_type:complete
MNFHTIHEGNINQPFLRIFGGVWPVSGFLGRILPSDVGKRIYLRGGILQAENNQQRRKRWDREGYMLEDSA